MLGHSSTTPSALLVFALASSLQLLLPHQARAVSIQQQLELNSASSSPLLHQQRKDKRATTYYQADEFSGPTFFDNFDIFNGNDPTHGAVNYVGSDSWKKGLVYIDQDGVPVMQVDSWSYLTYGAKRDSVRITTKKVYDGGLFILDFAWMPWGCSVWPAAWTFGQNWPNNGEIDIMEGVNLQTINQMALHSSEGCYLQVPGVFTGTSLNTDCSHTYTTAGCQIQDTKAAGATYGYPFNAQGGGVFALLWDGDGMKIWSFPASSIPTDIRSRTPNPSSWGTPGGAWAPSTCNPYKYFTKHQLVINIALCGDWAGDGAAYPSSGCPGTCLDQVMNPVVFKDARFRINSVRIYSASGLSGTVLGLGTTYNSSIIGGPMEGNGSTSASSGKEGKRGGLHKGLWRAVLGMALAFVVLVMS